MKSSGRAMGVWKAEWETWFWFIQNNANIWRKKTLLNVIKFLIYEFHLIFKFLILLFDRQTLSFEIQTFMFEIQTFIFEIQTFIFEIQT